MRSTIHMLQIVKLSVLGQPLCTPALVKSKFCGKIHITLVILL